MIHLIRSDLILGARSAWFYVIVSVSSLLAASLALTTRFGLGRETEMMSEMGFATVVAASFLVTLFGAEAILGKDRGLWPLLVVRSVGAYRRVACAVLAVAVLTVVATLLTSHALAGATLLTQGRHALGVCLILYAGLVLVSMQRIFQAEAMGSNGLLLVAFLAVLPVPAWFLAFASAGNLSTYFVSGLIFGIGEGILFSIVCVSAQAVVPGVAGVTASVLAFFVGNMKGFLGAQTGSETLNSTLEFALLVVPNFHALNPSNLIETGPSIARLSASIVYIVLFGGGLLAVSAYVASRRQTG